MKTRIRKFFYGISAWRVRQILRYGLSTKAQRQEISDLGAELGVPGYIPRWSTRREARREIFRMRRRLDTLAWSNQRNVPTDPSSGILGTELVDGEWRPKKGYRLLARFPGDMAYGPSPCRKGGCKDPQSHTHN